MIVTNSGGGYIDPIAILRDAPPKHVDYYDSTDKSFRRKWKCTYLRPTEAGRTEECGHIHWGQYPPEVALGRRMLNFHMRMKMALYGQPLGMISGMEDSP